MAKLPMKKNPKTGEMVPAFAMDGKGSGDLKKAKAGGKMKTTKGYSKGGAMKKKAGGEMKPVKKLSQGTRTRRPAPVEGPKYKDPLLQAIEEDRRIEEANKKKTKGKSAGGPMKKTKGYSAGGKIKKTKGYSKGGVARGMGAATRGGNFTRGA